MAALKVPSTLSHRSSSRGSEHGEVLKFSLPSGDARFWRAVEAHLDKPQPVFGAWDVQLQGDVKAEFGIGDLTTERDEVIAFLDPLKRWGDEIRFGSMPLSEPFEDAIPSALEHQGSRAVLQDEETPFEIQVVDAGEDGVGVFWRIERL